MVSLAIFLPPTLLTAQTTMCTHCPRRWGCTRSHTKRRTISSIWRYPQRPGCNTRYYLVFWLGLGPEHTSVLPEARVCNTHAWRKFEKRLNQKGVFFVDKVIDCRYFSEEQSTLYRVKWSGFGKQDSTWEPYCHVKHLAGIDDWAVSIE